MKRNKIIISISILLLLVAAILLFYNFKQNSELTTTSDKQTNETLNSNEDQQSNTSQIEKSGQGATHSIPQQKLNDAKPFPDISETPKSKNSTQPEEFITSPPKKETEQKIIKNIEPEHSNSKPKQLNTGSKEIINNKKNNTPIPETQDNNKIIENPKSEETTEKPEQTIKPEKTTSKQKQTTVPKKTTNKPEPDIKLKNTQKITSVPEKKVEDKKSQESKPKPSIKPEKSAETDEITTNKSKANNQPEIEQKSPIQEKNDNTKKTQELKPEKIINKPEQTNKPKKITDKPEITTPYPKNITPKKDEDKKNIKQNNNENNINHNIDEKDNEIIKERPEIEHGKKVKEQPQIDNIIIAFLGTDGKETKNTSSDAIILVKYNPHTKKALIISVPQYNRTNDRKQKSSYNKEFNTKHEINKKQEINIESEILSLERLFHIKINYFAKINFKGFVQVINSLDGVKVNIDSIPEKWDRKKYYEDEVTLDDKNQIILNGKDALRYVRYKDNKSGESARIKRQQNIMISVAHKLILPENIIKIPGLINIVRKNVQTNINGSEMLKLAWQIKDVNEINISQYSLKTRIKKIGEKEYTVIDKENLKKLSKKLEN